MKILMFGRTAGSLIYGQAFQAAGHEVAWKPCAFDVVTKPEVAYDLLDARSGAEVKPQEVHFVTPLAEGSGGNWDWIVAVLPEFRLQAAASEIAGWATAAPVLFVGQAWSDPRTLTAALPADRTVWALGASGGGVDEEGWLVGAVLPHLDLGTFGEPARALDAQAAEFLSACSFKVTHRTDMAGWLALHAALSAALGAVALAAGNADVFLAGTNSLRRAIRAGREAFAVLAARGVNLAPYSAQITPFRFPAFLGAMVLRVVLNRNIPALRVLVMQKDEADIRATSEAVLESGRQLGVKTPALRRCLIDGRPG